MSTARTANVDTRDFAVRGEKKLAMAYGPALELLCKLMRSSNVILRTLFRFKHGDICAILAKYRMHSLSLPVHIQKYYIWNHCVSKATDAGHLTFA